MPLGQRVQQARYQFERAKVCSAHPAGVRGVIGMLEVTTENLADEVIDLVRDTVRSGTPHSAREAHDPNLKAGFLGDLAHARRGRCLAGLAASARKRPEPDSRRCASADQKEPSGMIENNSACTGLTFRSHGVSL